jgi:hypothetical protein
MTIPPRERTSVDASRRTRLIPGSTASRQDHAFADPRRRSIAAVLQQLRRDTERRAAR